VTGRNAASGGARKPPHPPCGSFSPSGEKDPTNANARPRGCFGAGARAAETGMLSGCGPAGRRCPKEFCLGMAPSLPRQPLGPQHIPQREPRRAHLSRLNQRPPRQPQRTGKLGTAGGSRSVRHRQDCGGFHGATGELANRTFPNGRSRWQVGAMGGETGGDWASGRGTRAAIRSFCRRERPNLRGERCIALVNWRWDPSGPLPGDDQSPRGASTVTTRGKAPRQRPFQFKKTRCANRGVNPPVPPQRPEIQRSI
jgi:hypothetical protein